MSCCTFAIAQNSTKLKIMADEMNKVCPVSMGQFGTIDKFEYTDNTVIMTYSFTDGFLDIDAIKASDDVLRTNMLTSADRRNDKISQTCRLRYHLPILGQDFRQSMQHLYRT